MTDKAILPLPKLQFFDQDGVPLAGGKVFIYEAGTTTKAITWTGADGLTQNTNPVILDAQGRANIWVDPENPETVAANPPGPPGPQGPSGPPGPPGPTGNTAEFSNTIDITSETIYTGFFGEFIELVPAQNADQTILPKRIAISYKYSTIPYATNGANFAVNWGPPTFPAAVPNCTSLAVMLEGVTDTIFILPELDGLNGSLISTVDAIGKNLTITLDAAPDGAPLIAIAISDGGTGYAVGDTGTIDGGDGLATYEVTSETGGVVDGIDLTFGGNDYENTAAETTATGGGQPGVGTGLLLDVTSALTTSGSLRITTYYNIQTQQA